MVVCCGGGGGAAAVGGDGFLHVIFGTYGFECLWCLSSTEPLAFVGMEECRIHMCFFTQT